MPRGSLWIMVGFSIFSLACYERADRTPYSRYFAEVMRYIDRNYVEPIDDEKLFESAVQGMIGQLDPYSAYFGPSETRQFEEALDQKFSGIGIEVSLDRATKQLTVLSPLAGSPAYKAGLRAGDKILSVDGRSTEGFTLNDAVKALRGKRGTAVRITVLHQGAKAPSDYSLVRAEIQVDSVFGQRRNSDGTRDFLLPGREKIGYIRIDSFGDKTVGELKNALLKLSKQGFRGLILDLRNDPGGFLDAAKQTAELFIKNDLLIVSTRGRDAELREKLVAAGETKYLRVPMVVMVNRYTASAAEIVAACLQDHGRAVVVGERTWGKGTVQNVIPVAGGQSRLKLTIATYWRPSNKNIHRLEQDRDSDEWGVKPDPGLELRLSDADFSKWIESRQRHELPKSQTGPFKPAEAQVLFDPQLDKAVEYLHGKLTPDRKVKPLNMATP